MCEVISVAVVTLNIGTHRSSADGSAVVGSTGIDKTAATTAVP
jgi:hypothetical protein